MKKTLKILLLLCLFVSCNKDEPQDYLNPQGTLLKDLKQQIIKYLGYDETEIEFDKIQGKIYVEIQGDMLFEIDQIKEMIKNAKLGKVDKRAVRCDQGVLLQRYLSTRCRRQRQFRELYQSVVLVYSSSNVPQEWKDATRRAIERWNTLSNTLQFEFKNCSGGDNRYNNGIIISLKIDYQIGTQ